MVLRLVAMGDDDRFYTYDERIGTQDNDEAGFALGPTIGQVGGDAEMANRWVDELQALNTALCFLCSINADSTEVEHFLKLHPEALLLEGACLLPEDNAHYILQQREVRCTCQGPCHANRVRVLDLLDVGFEKFQARREQKSPAAAQIWSQHFDVLVQAECDIRLWRRQELWMRNTLAETAVEVRCYQDELDQVYRLIGSQGATRPSSALSLLCSRSVHPTTDGSLEGRADVLVYQVGVASVNLRSVEREHANYLQRIRDGRRTQFAVLQRAFAGCRRHAICSNGMSLNAPS